MSFKYAVLEQCLDRLSYDPSDLLKLYLWRYYNGIRSLREPENESYRNMEVMWLIRKLTPGFKTIADFRKNNVDLVKSLFRNFNLFLKDQDLFKSNEIAVDRRKVKAANSKDRSYSKERPKKTVVAIDEKIEKYLHDMDENDVIEDDIDGEKTFRLIEKLMEILKNAKLKTNSSGTNDISLTDREARLMKTLYGVVFSRSG
jgi:transposase